MDSDSGPRRRLARARYRVYQFTHGLRPFLAPHEVEAARAQLTPAEFALFLGAEARDRRHSFDLFEALRARDAGAEELTAALVHDVGKGRLRTWHRVAFVLLDAASPALARRLEAERGASWRQALWRLRHHAVLGAARLEEAGSAPRVVELVRRHTQRPPADDPALARFVALDDQL
ncbi:MAG: HD domain-containing protein [Dehalococcoidia bacterium]